MTASLNEAILAAKTREQIARWDAAETKIFDELPIAPPKTSLSADVLARLDIGESGPRATRSKMSGEKPVICQFIFEQVNSGPVRSIILALVDAIAQLHSYHGLSNPTATPWVHHALNMVVRTDPPRSWPKEDRVLFANP